MNLSSRLMGQSGRGTELHVSCVAHRREVRHGTSNPIPVVVVESVQQARIDGNKKLNVLMMK